LAGCISEAGPSKRVSRQTSAVAPLKENVPTRTMRSRSLIEPVTARIVVTTRGYSKDKPVSGEVFQAYKQLYAYDKRREG